MKEPETIWEEKVQKLFDFIKTNVSDSDYEHFGAELEDKIIMEEISTKSQIRNFIRKKHKAPNKFQLIEQYFKESELMISKKMLLKKFPMSDRYLYVILRKLQQEGKIVKVKTRLIKYWKKC